MATYFIGTSGWHYKDWRGRFYPEGLPTTRWLEYYSRRFNTVEINNSFYRLPTEKAFTGWHDSTPANFTFAVKASRFITHIKRLKDSGEAVDKFLKRARILGEKLGPMLYQLHPGMHRDDERLTSFLAGLPRGFRYVVEFRHQSWLDEEVFDIMRRHNVGLCVFDMPALSSPLVATADFAYVRFHGREGLYSSSYSDEELADWAGKISGMAKDLASVYVYFNNDVSGYAISNAMTIRDYIEKGSNIG